MNEVLFYNDDLKQMEALDISEEQVRSHIEAFKKGNFYLKLNRPCIVRDGIITVPEEQIQELTLEHKEAASKGRLLKFVPASGAASRMFEALLAFYEHYHDITLEEITKRFNEEDKKAQELLRFTEGIKQFAFFDDLKSAMGRDGFDVEHLIECGQIMGIMEYLLTGRGLNCANHPKGLLKFHRYAEESRTAVEEHLVEAVHYVQDAEGVCRLHITVSSEHREQFVHFLEGVKPRHEKQNQVRFHVDISLQQRSTDTIAVDVHNQPLRGKDGTILFRPGGHGTLIENLNKIKGDIVYIKNIDNVVPDRLKGPAFIWKKVLGGYLVALQKKIFGYLERLSQGREEESFVNEVLKFAKDILLIMPPRERQLDSVKEKRKFLLEKLNRPLRVCGVVRNAGEPGGGPFWVEGNDGSLPLQIVESAQVDMASKDQKEIWHLATHFNPVDIVCAVRDYKGNPFNLKRYVDPDAVFISRKSKDGRALKALELPGLWNGAM
ncbi:MAG: DUF4301 family protein, partial [Pseudomonadota bacterium]